MEQNLDKLLDETMESPGVVGVLCADKQGLCYSAKGTASAESAGIIASLSQQAALLVPESNSPPVICLESDRGNVLIKTHQDVTIAINKMPVYWILLRNFWTLSPVDCWGWRSWRYYDRMMSLTLNELKDTFGNEQKTSNTCLCCHIQYPVFYNTIVLQILTGISTCLMPFFGWY